MDFSLYGHIAHAVFWLLVVASVLAFVCLLAIAHREHDQAPITWIEALVRAVTQRR